MGQNRLNLSEKYIYRSRLHVIQNEGLGFTADSTDVSECELLNPPESRLVLAMLRK